MNVNSVVLSQKILRQLRALAYHRPVLKKEVDSILHIIALSRNGWYSCTDYSMIALSVPPLSVNDYGIHRCDLRRLLQDAKAGDSLTVKNDGFVLTKKEGGEELRYHFAPLSPSLKILATTPYINGDYLRASSCGLTFMMTDYPPQSYGALLQFLPFNGTPQLLLPEERLDTGEVFSYTSTRWVPEWTEVRFCVGKPLYINYNNFFGELSYTKRYAFRRAARPYEVRIVCDELDEKAPFRIQTDDSDKLDLVHVFMPACLHEHIKNEII